MCSFEPSYSIEFKLSNRPQTDYEDMKTMHMRTRLRSLAGHRYSIFGHITRWAARMRVSRSTINDLTHQFLIEYVHPVIVLSIVNLSHFICITD
jgi:hypothetical protein